jgi:hypothetical protein
LRAKANAIPSGSHLGARETEQRKITNFERSIQQSMTSAVKAIITEAQHISSKCIVTLCFLEFAWREIEIVSISENFGVSLNLASTKFHQNKSGDALFGCMKAMSVADGVNCTSLALVTR